MFSKSLLAAYQLRNLTLENPFEGTKLKRIPIKAHSPFPKDLIERIWKSASLLRDGDPEAPAPIPNNSCWTPSFDFETRSWPNLLSKKSNSVSRKSNVSSNDCRAFHSGHSALMIPAWHRR